MEALAIEHTLTELDHARLTRLVHRYKCGRPTSSPTLPIEQVLQAAEVVPWSRLSPDVVTMRSRVLLEDLQTGARTRRTLSFPGEVEADQDAMRVSVLSPLGCSLLGRRVGATVHWPTPSGGQLAARILAVLFQPESSGEFAR